MKHQHQHDINTNRQDKSLLWVTLLNVVITIVQIIGGVVSNSLSLLSDAIHNLSDSSAIFIAYIAGKMSRKKPDAHNTFGYKRINIIAALFNAASLIAICFYLFFEAYDRLLHPEPIHGKIMLIVASIGLLGNLFSVLILNRDKEDSLNIKAAYLHLMGDTLSSVAVIIGGIAIWQWNIYWIDPLITVLVGVLIIFHTWGVLKESFEILMQAAPSSIHAEEIKTAVERIHGIDNLHHAHIWKLDDNQVHLEAHIGLTEDILMSQMMLIRKETEILLKKDFNIHHITLQFDYNPHCETCPVIEEEEILLPADPLRHK